MFSSFRGDIVAGISVALVALPLCLGIAMASGFPPMAGITAAAIGGISGWIFGGTHVGIKGPANGSIVVLSAALLYFGGGENGIPYVLACIMASGLLLFLTGIFKLGKYAELLPTSAINGLLAGIGFIIVVKQIDEFFGYTPTGVSPMENFQEIPAGILNLNPIATSIAILSVVFLYIHPKAPFKLIRRIPAAIWVLLMGLPWALAFNIQNAESAVFLGMDVPLSRDLLVHLPSDVMDSFVFPAFERIGESMFWVHAFSIFIILLVENLLSAKAVDKMDPLNRKTDLNKDLTSSGFVTALSSALGGIPSITVIVRSSVNVNVGGKQRLSNIAHGAFLILILFFAVSMLNLVPKAALAGILVFTGFRLCSPKQFYAALEMGWEQLLIFVIAFWFTINHGLVMGIIAGTLFDFILTSFFSGMSLKDFWRASRNPKFSFIKEENNKVALSAKGVVNFLGALKLQKVMNKIPKDATVAFNFANAKLIDHTMLEMVHNTADVHEKKGGLFSITGLEKFHSSSPHHLALHLSDSVWKRNRGLTRRQNKLKEICANRGYTFQPEIQHKTASFQTFPFFSTRPPRYKKNKITGEFKSKSTPWDLCDLNFHEGEWVAQNELHTTLLRFRSPCPVPAFSVEPEQVYDRLREFAVHRDVHVSSEQLDKKLMIQGDDEEAIKEFFNEKMCNFLMSKEESFYIECNGKDILVFEQIRYATEEEIIVLIDFAEGLHKTICEAK